jgi:hypothetical protein
MRKELMYMVESEGGLYLSQSSVILNKNVKSSIPLEKWPESKVEYKADYEEFMRLAEEKEKEKRAKETGNEIPVDETGKFGKQCKVYIDENNRPWDVYLTKVNVNAGIYGEYVFYKI